MGRPYLERDIVCFCSSCTYEGSNCQKAHICKENEGEKKRNGFSTERARTLSSYDVPRFFTNPSLSSPQMMTEKRATITSENVFLLNRKKTTSDLVHVLLTRIETFASLDYRLLGNAGGRRRGGLCVYVRRLCYTE